MPHSSRRPRYHQLQLDLHFDMLGEVEKRAETEEAFEVFAKTIISNYTFTQKDPFWEAIVNENIL